MLPNVKLSEKVAILATLDPASVAASTVVSTWVPVANVGLVTALLKTGVLGASATVDAKLRQATDNSGTSAKDITGKTITQIVKATGDNKQAMIEVRPEELDVNGGFGYVALSVTVGTAASILDAVLIGSNPRFAPASAFNQAAVVHASADCVRQGHIYRRLRVAFRDRRRADNIADKSFRSCNVEVWRFSSIL
jgi:hypothetical protein